MSRFAVSFNVHRSHLIAGIDYSTRAVDVVLLDEDTDAATWHRFPLLGQDAFDRARNVRGSLGTIESAFWDPIIAIGIEDPRGYNAGALYRIQGAILACLRPRVLVHPLIPSQWRKTVGLPGNASKADVEIFASGRLYNGKVRGTVLWPQDAFDAYCIALATRTLIQKVAA